MYSKFASFENIFKGKVVDLKDHNQFDLLPCLGLLGSLVRVVLASGSTMAPPAAPDSTLEPVNTALLATCCGLV